MNVDENVCCKIKINRNINPITGNPFTSKEQNIKNEYIKICNKKLQGKPPRKSRENQDKILPINLGINLKNKNSNIKLAQAQKSESIEFTDKNKRSAINILKSPRLKKIINKKTPLKPKTPIKNLKIADYTFPELKNKFKNRINKKLTIEIFNKFKKAKKIPKNKYLSNLTKNEYIDLIRYLKL